MGPPSEMWPGGSDRNCCAEPPEPGRPQRRQTARSVQTTEDDSADVSPAADRCTSERHDGGGRQPAITVERIGFNRSAHKHDGGNDAGDTRDYYPYDVQRGSFW